MSDPKNTTDSPNIDDYLLNIDIEDNTATDAPIEQGLDMDFLNQLGGDIADTTPSQADSQLESFEDLNFDNSFDNSLAGNANDSFAGFDAPASTDANFAPFEPAPAQASTGNEFDFLNSAQETVSDIGAEVVAGVAAVGAGAGVVASQVGDSVKDTAKKGKGFFSGRFGKKPAPTAKKADDQENFTETLLASKNAKKGLFSSRQNKKEKPAVSTPVGETVAKKDKKSPFSFGKKTAKPTPATKAVSPDAKKKNQLLLMALACLALLGLVAYLFMNNTSTISTPAPVATTPAPAPTEPAPVATPAPDATAQPDANANANANAHGGENILPSTTAPNVNPDEILNAEIPADPALVKEEIDRLNDTGTKLDEQGKIIKEQLTIMEDLTTAKAEQIALLEKQIAELEKQKTAVATPAPSEQPAPAPANAPAPQQ